MDDRPVLDGPPDYIARPIREAHAQGLKVLIKPHIAYWGSPFRWRGEIKFARRAQQQRRPDRPPAQPVKPYRGPGRRRLQRDQPGNRRVLEEILPFQHRIIGLEIHGKSTCLIHRSTRDDLHLLGLCQAFCSGHAEERPPISCHPGN